jgi:hypothetical protein
MIFLHGNNLAKGDEPRFPRSSMRYPFGLTHNLATAFSR